MQINFQKGFTVLELVVAVSISSGLIFVVVYLLLNIFQNPSLEYKFMEDIDSAKNITSKFANELRSSTTGNDGSYQIITADDNEIIFFSKFGANSNICPSGCLSCVLKIRYTLCETALSNCPNGADSFLYKGITPPHSSCITYEGSPETVSKVIKSSASPAFSYFSGNYYESQLSNDTGQPLSSSNRPFASIKFVQMNLTVTNKITTTNTNTFTTSTGAAIRSVKENLSN